MTERLLQYIWQHQYFNKNEVVLVDGSPIEILHPGLYNIHQGPDFLEGRIRIGSMLFAGNIELHIKASDWNRHTHFSDPNYENVILHVVWINDSPGNLHSMPTLVLQDRVSNLLLVQYNSYMEAVQTIPCEATIHTVNLLTIQNWQERLVISRLQRKSEKIRCLLEQNRYHWQETFWWLIARTFGGSINGEAFEAMARSIPLPVIIKHKTQVILLEALFMGQSGLLERDFTESYPQLLKKEYLFLKNKYRIHPVRLPVHFLRMRPQNFPTVRLAQLAMLYSQAEDYLFQIQEIEILDEIAQSFDVTANDYWHYHYVFEETSSYHPKKTGDTMIRNIIINTIVPLLYVYGDILHIDSLQEKALHWLQQTPAEKNTVSEKFRKLGIQIKNAVESQAMIELKKEFCDKRRCLDCAIGVNILKG